MSVIGTKYSKSFFTFLHISICYAWSETVSISLVNLVVSGNPIVDSRFTRIVIGKVAEQSYRLRRSAKEKAG